MTRHQWGKGQACLKQAVCNNALFALPRRWLETRSQVLILPAAQRSGSG